MDYAEACAEQRRFQGLLEDNPHYQYRTTVQAYYDSDGDVEGYWLGVAWYAVRYDDDEELHEYGNGIAVVDIGASVGALKQALHRNYVASMGS